MTKPLNTYKDLLIAYCRYKSKLIHRYTGFKDYYNKEDFEELNSWSEGTCKVVLTDIREYLTENDVKDVDLCPWCTLLIKRLNFYDVLIVTMENVMAIVSIHIHHMTKLLKQLPT